MFLPGNSTRPFPTRPTRLSAPLFCRAGGAGAGSIRVLWPGDSAAGRALSDAAPLFPDSEALAGNKLPQRASAQPQGAAAARGFPRPSQYPSHYPSYYPAAARGFPSPVCYFSPAFIDINKFYKNNDI